MGGRATVGVLALQGDFAAHAARLETLGARVALVRRTEALTAIDAIVIPGGESTVMARLLGERGLDGLRAFAQIKPVFGTCAGAILLAAAVEPPGPTVGVIDMCIRRNAYGRQINSFVGEGLIGTGAAEMIFIRAPKILSVGPRADVIATLNGDPVGVRQGLAMAATFHPELGHDGRLYRMFLEMVSEKGDGSRA
jgi:5'-phosphate synthase pdxT subunit